MRVDDFDFDLPEERIALYPARPRDSARLLHVTAGGLADRVVADLAVILRPGDLLVANDTKVAPAQLAGLRAARAEGGASEPVAIDVTLHKKNPSQGLDIGDEWRAFLRPAKRARVGDEIRFGEGFSAAVTARDGAEATLLFNVSGAAFDACLAQVGVPPLPPYIARKRALTEEDTNDYQTIYAAEPGSVAAPTAGLHFTDGLLARMDAAGIGREMITLHVGAGTFLPVSADDTKDHTMHAEWGEITPEQAARINEARAAGGRIIAVGTTALRLLESAADEDGTVKPFAAETDIFITPGYRFRAVDCLMTNFHLPRSTLFMLVSAFMGLETMQGAYAHAIANEYRFYSYGDASFLERVS